MRPEFDRHPPFSAAPRLKDSFRCFSFQPRHKGNPGTGLGKNHHVDFSAALGALAVSAAAALTF
jgi:hypothetical protein